jgi:PadR family transcriptional regulator AphA
LEREGLATMTEVPQTSRPDKRLYRITPAGLTALQEWLASPDVEPDVFKSPLLLHLFFGRLVPYQVLITQLEAHQHKLRTELAGYETQERGLQDQTQALAADVPLPLFLMTLRFQINMIQAALTWTTEAVAQLERLQGTTK